MQVVAWGIVCLLVAVATLRRPLALALGAMSLWVLVPGIAAPVVTGVSTGPLAVHPAALLVLVGALVQLIERPRRIVAALAHRPEWSILLFTVAGVATAIGFYSGLGPDSFAAACNQVLGPLTLFLLLGAALLERPERLATVRTWFVVAATGEALLAIAQLALQSPILFSAQVAEQRFFRQNLNRWMGTLDHPLILSFLLAVALFLLASYRRWYVILPLMLAMCGGVVVTQSRVGVIAAVVAVFYVAGRAPLRGPAERVMLLLPLALGAVVAVSSGVTEGIQARVVDDTGSTSARADALGYFLDHVNDFFWLGQGLNGSFAVSDNAGLGTSFESAALMYSIDIGIVATVLYFGVMLLTVLRSFRRSAMVGVTGAAATAFLIPQSFSALSGSTAAPMIAWAVFALAGFGPLVARRRRSRPVPRRRPVNRDTVGRGLAHVS